MLVPSKIADQLTTKSIIAYDNEDAHDASCAHLDGEACLGVYGTLRGHLDEGRGGNHYLLRRVAAQYMGTFSIDRLLMFNAPLTVPYVAVTHDPADRVVMELYSLADLQQTERQSLMAGLDQLEGAPFWYHRACIQVEGLGAGIVPVWFYAMPLDTCRNRVVHPTGDWAYTGERSCTE
jgi:gamma-glutamylcyclotransferase (GGCT)/AIG2-like uncharacterized protein YtfP